MTVASAQRAGEENIAAARAQPAASMEVPPPRSVHTRSFSELLQRLGISLVVSGYQAGKLVLLRGDGAAVNTHFRSFNQPMGIAADGHGRLAVGTALEIWEFHNTPAVARTLEPQDSHDACFLPRRSHTTGDIQIHEMAWDGDIKSPDLWFINTRFSCLCTRSRNFSFVPRWRPIFVSQLAPEDRCHLNGLAMVDGLPRYVTALGEGDTEGQWRENKKSGGVLIDIQSNEIIARGLSMPHSPRWHAGNLWVLESGSGGLGVVDPKSGRYQCVAQLPGFTRGLDFFGSLAFVGLSQVRESATFSGIRIAERPIDQRACGVWVIDTNTGRQVAFLKFAEGMQEIFAVTVIEHRFPDVINDSRELIADSFVLPDAALGDVGEKVRRRI